MANYYAAARSNHFRVNNVEGLKEILPGGVELHEASQHSDQVCLIVTCPDQAGWPFWDHDSDEDDAEIHWVALISPFLLDDEVVIMMEAGAEKLRYISGFAFAFNNKGEEITIRLSDIYERAKDLGTNITAAEY